MAQANPIIWFEIYVQDMERAKAFYTKVFGHELTPLGDPNASEGPPMEMWAFPMEQDRVGAGGALVKMDGVPSGPGGSMVYFHCDDVAVEAARIEPAGGRLERPKTSLGQYGHMAIGYDTEGNMIGLHSMK